MIPPPHRLRHLRRRLPLRRLDAEGQSRQDPDVLDGTAGVMFSSQIA